ncbi:MAG: PEP-CTERM sorting domain-containing protein [Phycisphaerales bacterium]|nr:PEP-CTERM sorting domain-containing protein [Phycisphaerales bacterium]
MQRVKQSSVALAIGLGTTLAAGTAQADLLVYEGFDYADGSALLAQSGGSGWGGAWLADWGGGVSVNTPSLTYGDLDVLGNRAVSASESGYVRALALPAESVVYFSGIIKTGASVPNYIGFGLDSGSIGGVFFGKGGGSTFWQIEKLWGGTSANSTVRVTPDQTVLLVGKVEYTGANQVTASLWVNPTTAMEPGSADATYATTAGTFNRFFVMGNSYEADEIRIGTTFADVTPGMLVPEPASLGLLAVGGLIMLRRRR